MPIHTFNEELFATIKAKPFKITKNPNKKLKKKFQINTQ